MFSLTGTARNSASPTPPDDPSLGSADVLHRSDAMGSSTFLDGTFAYESCNAISTWILKSLRVLRYDARSLHARSHSPRSARHQSTDWNRIETQRLAELLPSVDLQNSRRVPASLIHEDRYRLSRCRLLVRATCIANAVTIAVLH